MNGKSRFPLGQLLLEKGIITQEQLHAALKKQKDTGRLLGAVLLEFGFVDQEAVFLPLVAGQMGVRFVHLKGMEIPADVVGQIPAQFASHYKIMPVALKEDTLTVATTTPLDVHHLDEIGLAVHAKIDPVLASQKDIAETVRRYYGVGAETIEQMMDSVDTAATDDEDVSDLEVVDADASISKFLNQILLEAFRDRATDIHIEPFEDKLQIRYRIDGVLYDAKVPANIKHFKDAINSRVKILSNLNIAEKRLPQDGRFKVRVGNVDLDLRISFLPTPCGESVVLRILNASRLYHFEELGLSPDEDAILRQLIQKPNGILFLTGPTGSGKTTTLYSCLASINTEDKKIITIEDPIEYQLSGITQIQINPGIGLSFSRGLRSMLRHDPDIMMVGEVRDKETAEIAVQVALTGHLVFSTLHTNDAASGVTRLLDMGVEPYLITSTVECFIAQRLVRLICPKCKEPLKDSAAILKKFEGGIYAESGTTIYEGAGCEACNFTGYHGRAAIYEFLVIDSGIRQMVIQRATAEAIKDAAVKGGMKTLRRAGWEKIKQGLTTLKEVARVAQEN